MTDQELLDAIKTGVTAQMQQALELDGIPQVEMHLVTQSYLLLKMLELLSKLYATQIEACEQLVKDGTLERITKEVQQVMGDKPATQIIAEMQHRYGLEGRDEDLHLT